MLPIMGEGDAKRRADEARRLADLFPIRRPYSGRGIVTTRNNATISGIGQRRRPAGAMAKDTGTQGGVQVRDPPAYAEAFVGAVIHARNASDCVPRRWMLGPYQRQVFSDSIPGLCRRIPVGTTHATPGTGWSPPSTTKGSARAVEGAGVPVVAVGSGAGFHAADLSPPPRHDTRRDAARRRRRAVFEQIKTPLHGTQTKAVRVLCNLIGRLRRGPV